MKIVTLLLLTVVVALSGCAGTQIEKLRKKIPAGFADTLNAKVTTLGGWGGSITGKNIDSDGRGHITADEYTEHVGTPWVTYDVDLTGSGVGKKRIVTKPEDEAAAVPVPK